MFAGLSNILCSKGTEPETPAGGETDPGVPWTRSRAEGI